MANNHTTLTSLFTDIADAIRVKTGGTDNIVADEFPTAIGEIETCPEDALFLGEKNVKTPFTVTGLRYLNGAHFAFAGSSKTAVISRSVDGTTWEDVAMPSTLGWYDAAYGAGTFVAIAYNSDVVATSYDGFDWTSRTMPSSQNWNSIAYGNGKFVAVSPTTAAYSTDGITWQTASLPSSQNNWNSVTYGNGKFVAIGLPTAYTSLVAYSTDGITWSTASLPIERRWSTVSYVNDKFLAFVGTFTNNTDTQASYSYDGVSWYTMTMPSTGAWGLATYGNGVYFAVIANNSTNSGDGFRCATSSDGITWTSVYATYPSTNGLMKWKAMDYGNGKFVLCNSYGNEILYSYDGTSWENTVSVIMDKNDADVTEETLQEIDLGDATAADVASGKTFTSASGIKVSGTLVPMSVTKVTANVGANKMSYQNDNFIGKSGIFGRTLALGNTVLTWFYYVDGEYDGFVYHYPSTRPTIEFNSDTGTLNTNAYFAPGDWIFYVW